MSIHFSQEFQFGLENLQWEVREILCSFYLKRIDEIFTTAGCIKKSDSETKFELVNKYYDNFNWKEEEDIRKFVRVINNILTSSNYFVNDETKQRLKNKCQQLGFRVNDEFGLIHYRDLINYNTTFKGQFQAGLPFGKIKPEFVIKAEKRSQTLKFELQKGIGIIDANADVYPNFNYQKLLNLYDCTSETDQVLSMALIGMNQTRHEKNIFLSYKYKFQMNKEDVPVLIPQAWIQWHSVNKRNLRDTNSLHIDDIYRVDFVVFWKNKRFVILVDDISHYAIKRNNQWFADQESYSKRLKEDRKLQKEGWQVFRISNWELRDERDKNVVNDILEDLREFIGF
ncbi:hypothetical protein ACL6C3_31360 [Capilliphycus salinus ALCB114379]|uniref:hypothetical protein n=1 Tax=Capilliphycus salinus TaxID=2768948 RepID=UPI0039A52EA0